MVKVTLQNLGTILREGRGDRGLREVAKEIGTSPATLSRVEGGKLPDITTFGKLCRWLELDPGQILGVKTSESGMSQPSGGTATAHLRAEREISADTAHALANVIMKAQLMLADLPEDDGGEGL